MRIVHVFPKSPFLSFTAGVFEEAAPGANAFLVLGTQTDAPDYRVPAGVDIQWIVPDAAGARRISSAVAASEIAVFHSVGAYAAAILAAAPPTTLKVWSGWGGDYYGSDASPTAGLLGPLTRRYERGAMTLRARAGTAYRLRRGNRPLKGAARAADVFSAPIPEDLAVFRKRFRGFAGRYAQLNYASLEDSFDLSSADLSGDDILLGNSASLANNHLDVLEVLRSRVGDGRRVIAPLSYGDPAYADAVTAHGTRILGSDFVALRDFMPFDEYKSIIARCSTVVMGHRRQQAIGNIAAAMWAGAHVILDERNPLRSFLADRGAAVASLSGVASAGLPSGRITEAQRSANIALLQDFWSRRRVVANARALIASA